LLSKLKELNPSLYSEWADESEDAAREAIEALSPANIEAARAEKSILLVVGTSDTYTPYESIRKSMDVIKIQKLKEILIARKNK